MLTDANLQFDPAGTAITVTAASTNVLDLLANRDLGAGKKKLNLLVDVTTSFTSGTATATLNVQLQGAPDNGSAAPGDYTTLVESGTIGLGQLVAGSKVAQFDIASVLNAIIPAATTTLTTTATSTSATVASATGLLDGQFVNSSGVAAGTKISAISGTTLTLSLAALTTTSAVTATFTNNIPIPRYLRLNYVASNTMTAGKVNASILLERDNWQGYPPGFTQPY